MIEGFKIKMTSAELKKHLADRAAHHRGRAETKQKQLPQLKEAMNQIKNATEPANVAQMSKIGTGYHLDAKGAVESLENDISDHKNKALVFDFFSAHLFDEDYVLDEAGLVRLEIIKRF